MVVVEPRRWTAQPFTDIHWFLDTSSSADGGHVVQVGLEVTKRGGRRCSCRSLSFRFNRSKFKLVLFLFLFWRFPAKDWQSRKLYWCLFSQPLTGLFFFWNPYLIKECRSQFEFRRLSISSRFSLMGVIYVKELRSQGRSGLFDRVTLKWRTTSGQDECLLFRSSVLLCLW